MWVLVTAREQIPSRILECDPVIKFERKLRGTVLPCNEFFAEYPNEPWYGFIADDISPESDHWHTILEETAGTRRIAFGDEQVGVPPDRIGSCHVIGGDLVRAAGWYMPPWQVQRGMDGVWTRAGRALNLLRYCPDVICRQLVMGRDRKPDKVDAASASQQHASKTGTKEAEKLESEFQDRLRELLDR